MCLEAWLFASEFRFRVFLKKLKKIKNLKKMAPVLTAGATTTEPLYVRVSDSAGARPMHPPARAPRSADRIGCRPSGRRSVSARMMT